MTPYCRAFRPVNYFYKFDPWFKGSQYDVFPWFSKQWHTVESSIHTVAELNEKLKEVQGLRRSITQQSGKRKGVKLQETPETSYVDAVVLSHEFSDHTHKDTLLELDPVIPILATRRAADLVRSWKYFKQVFTIPTFSPHAPDWRDTSIGSLPSWIGIARITTWTDILSFHSALLVAFKIGDEKGDASTKGFAEAIIYSPHGIDADSLQSLSKATPPLRTLALLHGIDDIRIGSVSRLNLGAHNGLKAHRMCQAKYWVSTHDELKGAGGIIATFLRRKTLTIQEAIEKENQTNGSSLKSTELLDIQDIKFETVISGQSLLLE